jgi:hypothetical protein
MDATIFAGMVVAYLIVVFALILRNNWLAAKS